MSGWTEQTVRAAASWQAFKEGSALFQSGSVVESSRSDNGWSGMLRVGKRAFRVKVVVKSATDLETRCGCPENQSSGAICAHAVAVALAALHDKASSPQVKSAMAGEPVREKGADAFEILLPQNWREALGRKNLPVLIGSISGGEVSSADERLSEWLISHRIAEKSRLNLNLAGSDLSGFLAAITDHPSVFSGKERTPIQVTAGQRVELVELRLDAVHVNLRAAATQSPWVEIGQAYWQVIHDGLSRLGEGEITPNLAKHLGLLVGTGSVDVPLERFLEDVDAWQEWVVFPSASWIETIHFVPAPPSFEIELDGSLQCLEASPRVKYDDAPAVELMVGSIDGLPRLREGRCEIRNLDAERQVESDFAKVGFQRDGDKRRWFMRGESAVVGFLTRNLPEWRRRWQVIDGPRLSSVQKNLSVVSPRIEILGSGEDWLSFDLKFQSNDGIDVSVQEVRRLLRLSGSSTLGKGGKRWLVADDYSDLISPIFEELDLQQEGGHYVASSAAGEIIRKLGEKSDKSHTNRLQDVDQQFRIPDSLTVSLRPYQQAGVGWLWDRMTLYGGAILADDMGLGKTLQSIVLIERLFGCEASDSGVVLVLATTSLLGNWKAEFERFAPRRNVRILHGGGRDVERERVQAGDVVITSYGTMVRDLAWYLKWRFRAVVVDEASLIRNPDTDYAKAIFKLQSAHRVALTGTPIENGVRDLWSIFRFVQPGWLGSREDFKVRYEEALAGGESAGSVMRRLKYRVAPFMLRRSKSEVASDLPSKIVIDEFCELSAEQRAVYQQLLIEGRKRVEELSDKGDRGAARMRVLTALLRLRQACCDLALLENDRWKQMLIDRRSAKLKRLIELLDGCILGGHKVLVFSQFQKQLLEIEKMVLERRWDCLRLDGGTRNRQDLVDRFQKDGGPPIFLISLKAGGYGLNLTAADTVVHFDPWWNPAAEAQATDRAHRIGQVRPVTVYRLLARGTVEDKVVRLQARKKELAGAIDEDGGGENTSWGEAEFRAILAEE